MKKKLFFPGLMIVFLSFGLFFYGCGVGTSGGSDIPGLVLLSSFENGKLYRTDTNPGTAHLYVLQLQGTYREMGRQYGYLLKDQMNELYETAVTEYLIAEKGISYEAIRSIAQEYYDIQSEEMKALISGMVETSAMTLEKQKIIAALPGAVAAAGCSALAAWGDYTTDRSVRFARNWDTATGMFTAWAKYFAVVVYNPSGADRSVADINYLGTIFPQTCVNDAGLIIDLNNGSFSDPSTDPSGVEPMNRFFPFLLSNSTLNGLIASFEAVLPSWAVILNLADSSEAVSYEWATYGGKVRTGDAEGILAATNHFVDSRWTGLPTMPAGAAGAYTLERRANLLTLGTEAKGSIEATEMMAILDTTIPDGGATFVAGDPVFETYYQIVFVPSQLQLWLKSKGYSGWEKVELSPLFTNN